MRFEPNKCESCHGDRHVLSVSVVIRYCGMRATSATRYLCDNCLMYSADLAKTALEVQGGPPTITESLNDGPKRFINRALDVMADAAVKCYAKLRGVRA